MNDITINPKTTPIGWIGTGVMGNPMTEHLIDAGFTCFVYNRTKSKTKNLIQKGAIWSDNPALLAEKCRIVFTMVSMPVDVEQVYFGDNGIFHSVAKGTVLIDMTTTKPSLAKDIYLRAKSKNCFALDAPVSGGDVGAKNAGLSIMVGGDYPVYQSMLPLMNLLGKQIVYQGEAGSGQHTKMCNQVVIATTMIGVCESLLYASKAGLNPEIMLQSIGKGAASCWSLDNLASRILKKNYEPGFYIEHFIKDLGIALEEAENMELQLPGLALANSLYEKVKALGFGKKGTQALMIALEELNQSEFFSIK